MKRNEWQNTAAPYEGQAINRPLVAKSPRWTPEDDDCLRRLAEEGRTIAFAEHLKRREGGPKASL
jgi:hypothetical protein